MTGADPVGTARAFDEGASVLDNENVEAIAVADLQRSVLSERILSERLSVYGDRNGIALLAREHNSGTE